VPVPTLDRPGPTCQLLVAAPGYGKTTALRQWYPAGSYRWLRAPDPVPEGWLAEAVAEALAAGERRLVVDDLPRLPAEELAGVANAVGERTGEVAVALGSRWPADRRFGWDRGRWAELGPADLALAREQVATLLADEYGLAAGEEGDPDLAEQVHAATGGWPALVHLAAETLRLDGVPASVLPAIARPETPLAQYLMEVVLAELPAEAVQLLRRLGDLAPVTPGLCRAIGDGLGRRRAAEFAGWLRRTGLLTTAGSPPTGPGLPRPVERVVPVVAEVARQTGGRGSGARVAAVAAAWYERHGPPIAAATAYHRAGDHAACAGMLDRFGDQMIAEGRAAVVAELVAGLPPRLVDRRLRLLLGDAQRTIGDLAGAEHAYHLVADQERFWDASLACRIGRLHYQRADARAALAAFARADTSAASATDHARLLTWTARAYVLAGDPAAATGSAERALELAGTGAARGSAHLSLALCRSVTGDAADAEPHYAAALAHAVDAGDVLLLSMVHTNRTYQLLQTGRYREALGTAAESARCATVAGSPHLRAIAACNQADALVMLGRYDEAARCYRRSLAAYQRHGSRRFAGALLGQADLHRRRGWREQARAGYEEAAAVAERAGSLAVLVPALAGLALVVLDDDPRAAAGHADRAAALAPEDLLVPALLAQGWVARHQHDLTGAAARAAEAARLARAARDRENLAEALELRAGTEPDPERCRSALRDAYGIWSEAEAVVEAARLRALLGRLPGATTEERLDGLLSTEQLAAAEAVVERAGGWAPSGSPPGAAVTVQALGRFEVRVAGTPVPASQWQSRKARDLLRILVARRGRPVPRDELCELLWPDDDPARTGHRLSVLLSIVRGVLDPERAHPAEHFLVVDQRSIALDVVRVQVDVEEFLAQVAHARRLLERGADAEARALLQAADRRHRADVFEDEPYDDWSVPLREEARAAYLSMLRMLARTSRTAAAGSAAAVGYLLRILERDRFDGPAHRALVRALVAAGQHGEARRAFARYREAMAEIGVQAPDEVILLPAGRRPAGSRAQ
jgi:DNA-binding SARP family transcriptional activator/ATP/maltotriose-dependent transcriptional regulator MalT